MTKRGEEKERDRRDNKIQYFTYILNKLKVSIFLTLPHYNDKLKIIKK